MAPALSLIRRAPMFRDRTNTIATAVLGALVVYFGWRFAGWAVTHAIWTLPDGAGSALCRAEKGRGACWAVVHERFRFILLGAYPPGEQWRPVAACALFMALHLASVIRAWWKPWLVVAWIVVPTAAIVLMRGGVAGIVAVPTASWGGLPLTFVLSSGGFAAAFPLAIGLALGRRSQMPAVRVLCIFYIELVRAVPLVTFLFMASVMFPLFVPEGFVVDKLLRAGIAYVMVIAAYLAEVVRAGLEAVPQGQHEAAASLGLPFWRATAFVVLPQALRGTIPAIVNTFITFFKDTSLVAVIGLFDLLGTAHAVIADGRWVEFGVEVYLFVACVYWVFCFAASRYGHHLEQVVARSHR